MKTGLRLALAVYFGFLMYSLLILLFGHSGIVSRGRLDAHRTALEENITELERIGTDLEKQRDALLHDNGEIELVARKLGYFREGEARVILTGMERSNSSYTLGRMIRTHAEITANPPIFRAIGFMAALCACIVVFLFDGRNHGRTARK